MVPRNARKPDTRGRNAPPGGPLRRAELGDRELVPAWLPQVKRINHVSASCCYSEAVNHASWVGPPGDILGYPVPFAQFIVKTEQVAVALQQVIAFPQG